MLLHYFLAGFQLFLALLGGLFVVSVVWFLVVWVKNYFSLSDEDAGISAIFIGIVGGLILVSMIGLNDSPNPRAVWVSGGMGGGGGGGPGYYQSTGFPAVPGDRLCGPDGCIVSGR